MGMHSTARFTIGGDSRALRRIAALGVAAACMGLSCIGAAQNAPVASQRPSGVLAIPEELRAGSRDPRTVSLLTQAFALEDQQRFAEAIERYKQILSIEPNNQRIVAPTYVSIAGCYGRLQRFAEQVSWALKAVAATPGYPNSHLVLGNGYMAQGQLERAAQEFAKVAELAPQQPDGYYSQGLVAEQQRNWKEAERLYRKAVEVAPSFVDAHFNLAALAANQKDFAQATKELRRVLEIDPLADDARQMLKRIESQVERQGR
jgi:tetratricopeptide (TPR) repeat protein